MDPNAEGGPPMVEIAETEVEMDFGLKENPVVPQPIQTPLASSIFRQAYGLPPGSAPGSGSGSGTDGQAEAGPSRESLPRTLLGKVADGSLGLNHEEARQRAQEEFQARLRGEYEAAQARLGDVVNSNLSRPLRLSSIRLSPPPPTTRSSFLNSLLNPFLSPAPAYLPSWLHAAPPPPSTLHEILLTTRALSAHLDQFGIFDMSQLRVRLEPAPSGAEDEVSLVLGLKEKGRLFLKAGTEVGGGEGGGNITARVRNVLGGAETLEAQASVGTKTKSAYQLLLSAPVLASPLLSASVCAFSSDRDNTAFASHRERAQGVRAKLGALCPWGTHELAYEYVQRQLTGLSPGASVSVRELASGPAGVPLALSKLPFGLGSTSSASASSAAAATGSVKSSLTHTWTSDTRDDPWLGTTGRFLKASHELAGLPGSSADVRWFKSTTQSAASRALYPGSNVRVGISSFTSMCVPLQALDAGFLAGRSSPAAGKPGAGGEGVPPIPLPDRTYLGGPNSVRGFRVGGLGPRDGQDSLGGDLAWAVGVSLFAPVPWFTLPSLRRAPPPSHSAGSAFLSPRAPPPPPPPSKVDTSLWPIRLHLFLNAGKLAPFSPTSTLGDNARRLVSNPSVSAGVGVMYRLDPVRVELNFSVPLVATRGERLARGFGVGVGVEFL